MTWANLPPHIQHELKQRLTQRQLDVLILHLSGCGHNRIALMLDIAPRTVRTHLQRAHAIKDDVERKAVA